MIATAIIDWFSGSGATAPSTPVASPQSTVTTDVAGNPTYPWQPGEALMGSHNRQVVMKRIDRLVGLPDEYFARFYGDVVNRFAGYVQLMPASESHHHARLGGLLDHSLDVAERALSIRRGHLLPPNRAPEVVARSADRWTYGVFLGALFHDVGKPATDLEVSLYDDHGHGLGPWQPTLGPMRDAARYYISFRKNRRYDQHKRIAAFIARSMLSDDALGWLAGDQDLLSSWLAALAGDDETAGVIGSIIAQSDGQSVAADLGGERSPRLSSARKRPLSEMLLVALKQLFEESLVHINRPGAEAWVTETDLWFVARPAGDMLREWLIGQGVGAVPRDNNRVFDELQQHKICLSTPADKAVWSVQVQHGDFDKPLTMLRFAIETVWPEIDSRPSPLDGSITVRSAETPSDDKGQDTADRASISDVHDFPVSDENDLSRGDDTNEYSHLLVATDEARSSTSALTKKSTGSGRVDWDAVTKAFFDWIAVGIADRRFMINTANRNGDLWVVQEGLLIRTPGVLREFSIEQNIPDYVALQKALERQGCLLMNSRPKPTVGVQYEMKVPEEANKLRGVVLTRPDKHLYIKLPAVCSLLDRARDHKGHF